jgi:hypothetical protein
VVGGDETEVNGTQAPFRPGLGWVASWCRPSRLSVVWRKLLEDTGIGGGVAYG